MRINLFRQSEFLKNSAKLVAGTAIAQGISFLVIPLITRLYTPADVGVFTFFFSIVGGFGLIATLRYEMAVVLPKKEKDSVNVVFISLLIAFFLCLALTVLIFLFNFFFLSKMDVNPVYGQWKYFLPAMVFLVASGNVFQHWYNRKKEYRTLAVGKVINSAGNNLLTLYLGFIGIGVWGLLLGNFLGLLLFNLFFIIGIILRYKNDIHYFDLSSQKSLARKYKDLPLANTPQMLFELVQIYGIVFLLQVFFSSEVLGWYSLSQRLLQAPLMLIGTSICQVFYKDASERFALNENIRDLLKKTIKTSCIISFPVMLIMLTIAPWLISLIFGVAWKEAGVFCRILSPWFFFDFIRYSISQTPIIIGKTRAMLYISIIGAILMIISVGIGGLYFKNVTASFILLSTMMSVYSICITLWIIFSVNKIANDN